MLTSQRHVEAFCTEIMRKRLAVRSNPSVPPRSGVCSEIFDAYGEDGEVEGRILLTLSVRTRSSERTAKNLYPLKKIIGVPMITPQEQPPGFKYDARAGTATRQAEYYGRIV